MHKILCKSFKIFQDSPGPSSEHRRIVVFHPEEEKSRFEWASTEELVPRSNLISVDDVIKALGYDDIRGYSTQFCTHAWTDEHLGHHV